ncbi:MAG: HNH endonuclease signature motif containing protein [Planctomycetota bacterium]
MRDRKIVRQDEAAAALKSHHRRRREQDVFAARQLEKIDRSGHYLCAGYASLAEFGEANGLAGREARMLAAVGKALELRPALEEDILSGKLSMRAVAALGRVFENPHLAKHEEDWLKCAAQWPADKLEREIRKKELEAATDEPVSVLFALLTATGRARFERARVIASRKRKKRLSEGETVEVMTDHYLESFDPDWKRPRKRRTPDTTGRPGRHVPEEVKRAVRARPHGDRCAVPGCENKVFLNFAHKRPHWDGGSREEWNLHYLCPMHNRLYDEGKLQITGPPDRPVFHFADGRVVEGFEPPTPGDGAREREKENDMGQEEPEPP